MLVVFTATGPANAVDRNDIIEALTGKGAVRGIDTPVKEDKRGNQSAAQAIERLRYKSLRGLSVDEEDRKDLRKVVESGPSIDLEIPFEFNSSDIASHARPLLSELGAALTSKRLAESTVVLAGYTDAKGGFDYNQALSERRAQSVRSYLRENFGVGDGRMIAVGYGEQYLKNPSDPKGPENRRVQIVKIERN